MKDKKWVKRGIVVWARSANKSTCFIRNSSFSLARFLLLRTFLGYKEYPLEWHSPKSCRMEYCAAQCPYDPQILASLLAYDVYKDPGGELVIAAVHFIYLDKDRFAPSPTHKLFEVRTNNLVKYVVDALGDRKDEASIKAALENAFARVDAETADLAAKLHYERPGSLETKYNSDVFLVTGGCVFAAGIGDSRFLVMGGGKFRKLSTSYYRYSPFAIAKRQGHFQPEKHWGSENASSPLYYFRKDDLQEDDEYVVVANYDLLSYIPPSVGIAAVLDSRIAATGLEMACKSMVGPIRDSCKIIIVVDLNKQKEDGHERKPMAYNFECDYTRGISKYPLSTDLVHLAMTEETIKIQDPLRYLLPLRDGCTKQEPLPQTSCKYLTYHEMRKPFEDEIKVSYSLTKSESA